MRIICFAFLSRVLIFVGSCDRQKQASYVVWTEESRYSQAEEKDRPNHTVEVWYLISEEQFKLVKNE